MTQPQPNRIGISQAVSITRARRTVAARLWTRGDRRVAAQVRAGQDDGCFAMRYEITKLARESGL